MSTQFWPQEVRDRVLVVDDTQLIREFLVELLSERYEVISAAHGPSALEAVEDSPPKAAIIDYDMPGMTGDRLAALLSARYPETVLILHSARSFGPEDPVRAPFDFYIQKPVMRISDIERIVRLAVNLYGLRTTSLAG